MPAHHYPFIDLAVHASVRDHFAKGDAVAVLSRDLSDILWANGAAAQLFGFSNIYDVLDEGFGGQTSTRRQIESAVSGLGRTGKPQNFMMRVASGFSRLMVPATLEDFVLPDGAQALLLTSSQAGQVLAPGARARQIIAGFEGTGTHVAVLDKDGHVLAASSTFSEIGLANADIDRMVADVAGASDRLVKRMANSPNGAMPTAIGRLADDPVLHLLFTVEPAPADQTPVAADDSGDMVEKASADEITQSNGTDTEFQSQTEDETATVASVDTDIPTGTAAVDETAAQSNPETDAVAAVEEAPRQKFFDTKRIRDELNARLAKAEQEKDLPAAFTDARDLDGPSVPEDASNDMESDQIADDGLEAAESVDVPDDVTAQTAEQDVADDQPAMEDIRDQDHGEEAVAKGPEFHFDPEGKPARFVWKINRDGEFSEVSPEFAAAVGPHSADIIGRKFPDLARVFNLDPDHIISDLLSRRDTWSGKTVFWPVQGTDLVTPVDLAALPTYTRDRRFDGFRGFGIVRTGETRRDPEALGLALVPGSVLRSVSEKPMAGDLSADQIDTAHGPDTADHSDVSTIEDDADLEMRDLERDIEELSRMDGVDAETTADQPSADDADAEIAGDPGSDDTSIGEADPFRGERPAIRLVETPMRRDSDKIINLEARRPRMPRESLSPGEQAAFREIGVRLTKTSAPDADTPAVTRETKPESAPPALPQEPQTFGKRQAPGNDDQAELQTGRPETEAEAGDAEISSAQSPNGASSADDEKTQTAPVTTLPSAFALPARQVMPSGMDAGIIDAIPAALLVHSGDELIHGNAEFFELTGYGSLEDLADCGGLDHLLERPSEDETSSGGGLFVRRGDGGRREITARLRSVNWGDGQALLLALSPRESTTAPIAEVPSMSVQPETVDEPEQETEATIHANALEIETQELRSILETATDGVVILNDDGTIRSMNGSACGLFNYDENETHNQPFAMLFAHESQRAVMDYVSGLADHGVSSVLNDGREVIGREASGGFLPLFMTIGRLSGSNGYCAVLRDITNWKRTEEELRNAKRAAETANSHKSDFLARVSHEIRTPLNAIIGFSEMMAEERFGPIGSPRYLEYAHDIGNSGKHVLDIVNDLLDISKIEAGQVSMEFVSVSLNDHLAESVSLLQPMANSQRVIIRTSLSASVPEVVADQRSIKQIALNLLSNAIRYTPSGGQIVVSTSYEPSGNVVIRIRDTGIGMNRKELEQAMKPFGQVGPGPRQRGDGTGLGLPLTKAMVEANRAQFDIVSAPGEGTLVSIAFPPQRVLAD